MEKRKMQELEILDNKGMLEYTIIPNYKVKENFITDNELKLYKVLKKVAYELKFDLFTQVALNRILEVNNRRKQQQLRNRIDKKSIDFVLYDEKTKKIVCCIELDDSTHEREERIERDLFLDKSCKNAIKLIRIKVQKYYDYNEILNKIIDKEEP